MMIEYSLDRAFFDLGVKMKKVIVVSKTHLDLGFTDYAESIRRKYIDEFIPSAVELSKKVNTKDKKKFVWTTGSWILKEALENGTDKQAENLKQALKCGNIVPHAMPFTVHTELLDADTLEYGLLIVNELDEIRGKKTISAKMTDVPGHTIGLVKSLAGYGIKLLHIGVNDASALVDVPPCFLWRNGDSEIVVIYSGDYGGAFKSDLVDEVLYFDHTLDNHGAPDAEKLNKRLGEIQAEYPDYEIEAGTMDEFAEIIWDKRSQLPVITAEIGDTWIHGSAADPYKSAALRSLMALKSKWLSDGTMSKNSREYTDFSDSLLCIAEHTCGMDTKLYFADYENYLKSDFKKARVRDVVKTKHPFRDFPQNIIAMSNRKKGSFNYGSYSVIEKSWQEQREYINKALKALHPEHLSEAEKELAKLMPTEKINCSCSTVADEFSFNKWYLKINEYGSIELLKYGDETVVKPNNKPCIEYRSYCEKDYDFWKNHYTRDYKNTFHWCEGDFLRPLMKYCSGKYPIGSFYYRMNEISAEKTSDALCVTVSLECIKSICDELGAPRIFQICYTLTDDKLDIEIIWLDKDANRLTEAIFYHISPDCNNIRLHKIDTDVDPYSVVSDGGRNLHAIAYAEFDDFRITNHHSPLFSLGRGKILEFDNKLESIENDGISYVLYDNVWGTNFPLWYEDNAYFKFTVEKINRED